MDRKFFLLIILMLIMCLFIIGAAVHFYEDKNTASTVTATPDKTYVTRYFNKDSVIDIHITLGEADFEDMLKNPTKEEYKQASVSIDGETVDNVGFRTKGNSSLNSVARSNSSRFSFKIEFDHYIDGLNLDGLTKLNLNNSFSDSSFMREYLSYLLLEEMKVPVPACSYANLYINGNLNGLYLMVEAPEVPFLQRYYGSDYGVLYKPYGERGAGGTDLVYKDDNIESYKGLQAVTEPEKDSDETLLEMIKALNTGQDLEKHLNIDEILRYFAVNTVLVNMDSYQGQFSHNYYLYEENGVFSLLPWDYNMSFGGFGMGGNRGSSTTISIDQPVSGTTLEQRPLLGKLLEIKEYKELYYKYIREFITGPFTLEKMKAEIEKTSALIRPYVEKDPTRFGTIEQFEQAVNPIQSGNGTTLIKFISERIDNVNKQLNGEVIPNTSIQTNIDNKVMRDRPENRPNLPNLPNNPPVGIQRPNDMREPNQNLNRGARPNANTAMGIIESTQQLYMIGSSLLILIVSIFLLFKKRNKYSL